MRLYGTSRWRKLSRMIVVRDAGICRLTPGCPRPATVCDHVIPAHALAATGRLDLFFDPENLRAACRSCNARAGASYGVSLGRQRRRATAMEAATAAAEAWAERYEADMERLEVERRVAVKSPRPRIY